MCPVCPQSCKILDALALNEAERTWHASDEADRGNQGFMGLEDACVTWLSKAN